jgi:transcriptional regulator with XRE-family HTH domain
MAHALPSIARRIAAARRQAGWSQHRLAAAVGAAQTTVSSWERGRTEPGREDVRRIAEALDQLVARLELDSADRGSSVLAAAPLVGFVAAGSRAHFFADGQGPFDEVAAPDGSTEQTVAVEIRGDSLGSFFNEWLVYYDDVRAPVTPDLIGRLCVVGLVDGRVLIKKIKVSQSPGLYHLLSQTEEPLLDGEVVWAARVRSMTPR